MTSKSFLDEVRETCEESREGTYGSAYRMQEAIAEVWNWYLSHREVRKLEAFDVGTMMALLKIARIAQAPEDASLEDSIKDLAGYAWVMNECRSEANHPSLMGEEYLKLHEEQEQKE